MLLICTLSKLIVSTGLVTIILQVGVGVISYIGMLILLKEDYIYIFINKIKDRFLKKTNKNNA